MDIHWFIPTHGDGRYLGAMEGGRGTDFRYLRQVAEAADRLGFKGVLIPTGRSCEDAWVAASALAPFTERLKFLVAVRPGLVAPAVAARMAATLDRFTNGRVMINVVAGGDPVELAGDGLFLDHDERYAITDEFLRIWKGLFGEDSFSWSGRHLRVEDSRLLLGSLQPGGPPLYLGGSSPAAQAVAAEHVDVYLSFGEPVEQVREKIGEVSRMAEARGRRVEFGVRLHVIVRETSREAWKAADALIRHVTPEMAAAAGSRLAKHDSVGQRRMAELHGFDRRRLEIAPNLWAGIGLVRGNAGTALVGSADEVAERLREYAAIGVSQFILSGYPHLEEAYRVAELLFPKLEGAPSASAVPGEVVANAFVPELAASDR